MYLFMFIITFLMSLKTSWAYNNFTYLSYQPHLRIYYLIWVTLISCFLLFKVIKLFKHITYLTIANKFLIGSCFISTTARVPIYLIILIMKILFRFSMSSFHHQEPSPYYLLSNY